MGHETFDHANEYGRNPDAFIYLKVDKHMQKIFINEVLYIESWKDYIKLFLTNGKNLLVKQSISAMENLLSEHQFIRVHRSYIVSVDKILGYNGISLKVQDAAIPIGRLYKQKVVERLR